jgi:hypothetical protein
MRPGRRASLWERSYSLVGLGAGGDDADALDAPGPDEEVGAEATAFVDDLGVAEDDGVHAPTNQTSRQPTANGKTSGLARDLHHVRKVGFLDAFRVDVDGRDAELGLLVLRLQDEVGDDQSLLGTARLRGPPWR